MQVSGCLAIKGAEDSQACAGNAFAFEISTVSAGSQYFIAPDSRVRASQCDHPRCMYKLSSEPRKACLPPRHGC